MSRIAYLGLMLAILGISISIAVTACSVTELHRKIDRIEVKIEILGEEVRHSHPSCPTAGESQWP